MADWYPTFFNEVRALVLATWTDIAAPQFYTSVQAMRQNIVSESSNAAQGDAGSVAAPYAVLQMGRQTVESGISVDATFVRMPVVFHYIQRGSTDAVLDTQEQVNAKAEALKEAIENAAAGAFTTFQWVERGDIDSSESNPVNDVLLDQNVQLLSASLSYDPGLLVLVT